MSNQVKPREDQDGEAIGPLETKAFELTMEVVMKAKNNQPYKHLLTELKKALEDAPRIKAIVGDALRPLK